jgi:hypothetical protein
LVLNQLRLSANTTSSSEIDTVWIPNFQVPFFTVGFTKHFYNSGGQKEILFA